MIRIFSSTNSGSAFPFSAPQTLSRTLNKTMSETSGASLNYEAILAIVSDDILPNQIGRVSFRASWWPALCPQNIHIPSGTVVKVIGRTNITLLVEPL